MEERSDGNNINDTNGINDKDDFNGGKPADNAARAADNSTGPVSDHAAESAHEPASESASDHSPGSGPGPGPASDHAADSAPAPQPAPSFSGVFRAAFACFKQNIGKIVLLVLSVTLPLSLIQVFLVETRFDFNGVYDSLMELSSSADATAASTEEISGLTGKLALYLAITALISSISVITVAGIVILVGRHNGLALPGIDRRTTEPNAPLTFNELFEGSFRAFPKLWLTQLFVRISLFCGLMLCFLPGLIIYYVFQFAVISIILTGLWGRKATFVSSLATRKFPKASLISALMFFACTEVLLPMLTSGIISVLALLNLNTAVLGIIKVLLACGEQLIVLFATMAVATLFAQMLPVLEPIIDSSGVRGDKKAR